MSSGRKFKRIISIITAAALAIAAIPAGSLTHHADAAAEEDFTFSLKGQGTATEPYLIKTTDDLVNMRDAINGHDTDEHYSKAYYRLEDDIDLESVGVWYPIGRSKGGTYLSATEKPVFGGVFDGNGHKISGLKITNDNMFSGGRLYTFGLFGKNEGTIKNLSVEGNVNIPAFYVGLICGINDGTIENCSAAGEVFGTLMVGGIAGICDKDIKNCFSNVKSKSSSFGAIAGLLSQTKTATGKVENCYFNKNNTSTATLGAQSDTAYGLTETELARGSAAWGLQNGQDTEAPVVWGQDLSTDKFPMLKSTDRVYKVSYMLVKTTVAEDFVNGNSTLTPPTVEYSDKGYSSGDKWFKNEDHSTEWNFDSDTVTADISLYSERTPIQYTITLETKGGVIEDNNWKKESDGKYTGTYDVTSEDITLPSPEKEGYSFVGWTSSQDDDSTGEASEITIKNGSTGDRTYEAVYLDITAPTILIEMGGHHWAALHENPTFDLYFNQPQTISVTASDDDVDDVLTISYYISDKKIADEDLDGISWKEYTGNIELKAQQKAIVYVRVTDEVGNSSYASTTGIMIDFDGPVITGVADNGEYCADAEFSVTDNGAVAKIEVNKEVLFDSSAQGDPGVEEGPSIASVDTPIPLNQLQSSYKIENTTGERKVYVITVTDKAGNIAKRTVTLNGGHIVQYKITEQIAYPTCTEPGLEYLFICCKECGGRYQTEVRQIQPLGHNWKDWETVESPDCDNSGSQKRTCARCGLTETKDLDPNGHDWEDHPTIDVAPTCKTEGSQSVHCKKCEQTKEQTVIPAKGHTFGDATDEIEKSATCTADGRIIHCYVCQECGETLRDPEVVPALGHTFGEWEELKSGVMQRECSVCGHIEERGSTTTDHKWNTDYTVDKEATCTTEGSESIRCSVCGAVKEQRVIPAKEHDHDEPVKENEKAATCTEDGSYEEVVYCKNCRQELHRVPFTVPSTGHTWGEWKTVESPDCNDEGTQQRECTVCKFTEESGLAANGHDWEDHMTVDVDPTCTTDGSRSFHCKKCEARDNSEIITATGHDWTEWETLTSAGCETEGTQQRECTVCATKETKGLAASGHQWSENYIVDKAPDCTTDGSESIHCINCDAIKDSRTIPYLGHKWSEWETVSSPDCDDEGTQQRSCEVCGIKETKGLEASGHDWKAEPTVDKPATCTEEGSKSVHCKNCKLTKDPETIPALGHEWSEWTVTKTPDCTTEGEQERSCTRCTETEIEKLAPQHEWEDHYTVDVEMTCLTDGSESVHCSKCDETKDSRTITAPGHHTPDPERKDVKPATTLEDGYTGDIVCEVCGEVIEKGEVISAAVEYKSSEGAPQIVYTEEDGEALKEAVLGPYEQNTENVQIILSVSDASQNISADAKRSVDDKIAEMSGDYKLGQYLEIDIMKMTNNNTIIVNQLNNAVKITLNIPDALKASGRTFKMVRLHVGEEAAVLADEDSDPYTITFRSDKFSVYAIVYVDAPQPSQNPTPSAPTTSDTETPADTSPEQPPVTSDTQAETTAPEADDGDDDVPPATGSALPAIPFAAAALAVTVLGVYKKSRKAE